MTYEEQLNDLRWQNKRDQIIRRDKKTCSFCHDSRKTKNVHHRYYIYEHLAWEYDDNALVTLCPDCHNLIHDTLAPQVYSEEGTALKKLNLTPCHRCGGRGYFEEYKNISNGICFRCQGAKFEELIAGEQIDIKKYVGKQWGGTNDCIHFKYGFPLDLDAIDIHQTGLNRSLTEGFEHIYKEAVLGDSDSQYKWAIHCLSNLEILPEEYHKSVFTFLCYSGLNGSHKAQLKVAEMLQTGFLCSKNEELSEKWRAISESNRKFSETVKEIKQSWESGKPIVL